MVLHMRKCELLRLPSFAAYSCLLTHDRGNNGAEELRQEKERTIKAMERERDSLRVCPYPLQSHNYLIPRLTQEELALWHFPVPSLSCPAGWASGSSDI